MESKREGAKTEQTLRKACGGGGGYSSSERRREGGRGEERERRNEIQNLKDQNVN